MSATGADLSPASRARLATPSAARFSDRRLAEAALVGVMVLWGANFIVVKSALLVLPPVGFTFLRFAIASATLLVLLRWREGTMGLPRRDLVAICGLGAIGFGVYQILWTTGLTTVAAGDSALLIASTPVLVAIFAVAARSDSLTPTKLLGAIVSLAGVAAVIASGPGLSLGRSLGGEVLTLLGAACWAFYMAFGAPFLNRYSPLRTTAWATVAGTIVLAPIATSQLATVSASAVTPGVVGAVLYSGFLAAGVSNVIVQNGVRAVGPTRTAAYQFLVPALAVVFAALFLGEAIRPGQVIGGLVIVAGVLITRGGLPFRVVRADRPRA
ncbi:MAG TPA: DMT family transporter [Candidatus Limnocylindrales bacterium]|nr:DMT family transporter [Candidatus Limnocylindrales bacterium]